MSLLESPPLEHDNHPSDLVELYPLSKEFNQGTNMITSLTRFAVLLCLTALLVLVSTGCNTAHGFGKDMQDAGEGIQRGTD
jgi:predicted small secreted protein